MHEPPPPLEQVRPRVGRLDRVADRVRQRRLDDLPRVVGLLGRPVPEAGKDAGRQPQASLPSAASIALPLADLDAEHFADRLVRLRHRATR